MVFNNPLAPQPKDRKGPDLVNPLAPPSKKKAPDLNNPLAPSPAPNRAPDLNNPLAPPSKPKGGFGGLL